MLFTADTTAHTHSIVTAYADASQGTVDGFRPWGVVVDAGGIIFVAPCPGSHGAGAICTVNRTTGVRTVWSDWGDANQGTTGVQPLSLAIATGGSTGGASPFRPVSPGITIGPDLGGTGHPAVNATGSAGSGGKSLVALFDSTPTDPATKDVFGSVSLSADVMMTTFNNKEGAGLLALFNEAVGKKGRSTAIAPSAPR